MLKTDIQPFGVSVSFFTDIENMEEYLQENFSIVSKDIKASIGKTIYYDFNIIIGVFDKSISTLMHECSHASLYVFKELGLNPFDSNGEYFCYMNENLFKELSEGLYD